MAAMAPPVEGPRLGDLSVSAATYGLPIMHGWGLVRTGGNMIWTTGIKESSSIHSGKGSLGGKSKEKVYTYTASFAFAFAAGPADRILRIWADSKLVYDETGTGPLEVSGVVMRRYLGTEDQMPDPAIVADKGTGNVPAFRGLVYLVAEHVPLEPFGNRIPNITAEIAFHGQVSNTMVWETNVIPPESDPLGSWSSQLWTGYAFDLSRNLFYRQASGSKGYGISVTDLASMERIRVVSMDQLYANRTDQPPLGPSFSGRLITVDSGNGTDLYAIITVDDLLPTHCDVVRINPVTMLVIERCTASFRLGVFGLIFGIMGAVNTAQSPTGSTTYIAYNIGNRVSVYDGTPKFIENTDPSNYSDTNYTQLIPGNTNTDGSCDFWFVQTNSDEGGHLIDIWRVQVLLGDVKFILNCTIDASPYIAGAPVAVVQRIEWDRTHATLLMWIAGGTSTSSAGSATATLVSVSPDSGFVYWSILNFGRANPTKGASLLSGTTFAEAFGDSRIKQIDTGTGALLMDVTLSPPTSPTFFGNTYNSTYEISYQFALAVGFQSYRLNRGQAQTAVLGDIVRDICIEAGLETTDVDVTALTDSVRGYSHAQEMARNLISDLGNAFFFDGLESMDRVIFKKRGGSPVFTIPFTDVVPIGNAGGSNTSAVLPVQRSQAETIPRRVWVQYADYDHSQQQGTQMYARSQAPASVSVVNSAGEQTMNLRLVLTASEAKTLAMKRLLMLWAERDTFPQIGLGPKYLALDPADVVTLTLRDGSQARVRIDSVSVGTDLSMQVSGSIEDVTLFSVHTTAFGGDGVTPTLISAPYTAIMIGPELPLIRDVDDTHGTAMREYATFGAYSGQTFGGAALYVSDDNVSWSAIMSSVEEMSWGVTMNKLGSAPAWATDRANYLDVWMVNGTPETCTYDQLVADANAAVLVNSFGQAEIIQYQTATPMSGNTYRLTGIVRGRRGSEWAIDLHEAGEQLALLEMPSWNESTLPLGWLGLTRYEKVVGLRDSIDSVPTIPRVFVGTAEKPYAPTAIASTRNGDDDLIITWLRRTRVGGDVWTDTIESVALSEASENYDIEILASDGTVLRTLHSTTPTVTYLFADQTTDGLDASPVTVRIFQLSAAVGRGYGAIEILPDTSGGFGPTTSLDIIALSNDTVQSGLTPPVHVGSITIGTTGSPFSGSLSLTGVDAPSFDLLGNNLRTSTMLADGTYNVNIAATQGGATGSPLVTPFLITASSMLVPVPLGASLGLWWGDSNATGNMVEANTTDHYNNFVSAMGVAPSVIASVGTNQASSGFGSPDLWPGTDITDWPIGVPKHGVTPCLTWIWSDGSVNNAFTMIATGDTTMVAGQTVDYWIQQTLLAWKTGGFDSLYIRPNWEFNQNFAGMGVGSSGDIPDFIAAWRHFANVCHQFAIDNAMTIKLVWCPSISAQIESACFGEPCISFFPTPDGFEIGGRYVDVVAPDVYAWGGDSTKTIADVSPDLNVTTNQYWYFDSMVQIALAFGCTIGIAELGDFSDAAGFGSQTAWTSWIPDDFEPYMNGLSARGMTIEFISLFDLTTGGAFQFSDDASTNSDLEAWRNCLGIGGTAPTPIMTIG